MTNSLHCTLPAAALDDRLAMIRREIVPHVVRVEARPSGFALELVGSPALHARLVDWVALERECCGGVGWTIEGDAAATLLRLIVDGIDARQLERLGLHL